MDNPSKAYDDDDIMNDLLLPSESEEEEDEIDLLTSCGSDYTFSPSEHAETSSDEAGSETITPANIVSRERPSTRPRNAAPRCQNSRIAKTGLEWKTDPPAPTQTLSRNVIRFVEGPARNVTTSNPKSAFDLFITKNILEEIMFCTNKEGKRIANGKGQTWKNITSVELTAFFGLLILAGVERNWDVSIRELFSSCESNPHYRACMTRNRFELIRQLIRFDDKRTRPLRLQTDNLAAISFIWKIFLENCKKCYVPSENLTIDEQLMPFRGRCRFVQYMPQKPSKYGIKIFWLCDAKNRYAVDGIIYTGRQPGDQVATDLSRKIVLQLISSLENSGRNITCDNYFTSIPLAQELLSKRLTVVGTLRHNKREIPEIMKSNANRAVYSSEFGFQGDMSMVSYVPKKNKSVILLSTMHKDKEIVEGPKRKPEIIVFYNSTKSGVDTIDQMSRTYSTKRQTRRWPFALFMNILDMAGINACHIYEVQHPEYNMNVTHKRRVFLKELAKQMILPQILERASAVGLHKDTVDAIALCGVKKQWPASQPTAGPKKRKRCYKCPASKDRKTSTICGKCQCNVCGEHSRVVCNDCLEKQN